MGTFLLYTDSGEVIAVFCGWGLLSELAEIPLHVYFKFSYSQVSGGIRGKTIISIGEIRLYSVFPTTWNRLISENVCRLNINVPAHPVENKPTYTDHTR